MPDLWPRKYPFRDLWERLMDKLLFGCPPHELGPMQKTAFGNGQKCSKCRRWRWESPDDVG